MFSAVAAARTAALRARPLSQSPTSLLSQFSRLSLHQQTRQFHITPSLNVTLNQSMRRKKPAVQSKVRSPLLLACPQRKAVVLQVSIAKPKKPNSAKRKVARVRLSTGKSVFAYIPGEGHNLQEHSVVMIRGGRTPDLPGVKYKVVRGALDFGAVVNRVAARSKYGAKRPKK